MELGFIVSAVRRYLWVVIACGLLGLLPALTSGGSEPEYESLGVLAIVPPADSAGAYVGDPDRYVIGQLSVLRSATLANAVAADVPDGDAPLIASLVEFEHLPETDIVIVHGRSGSAEFSRQIVDGYLDAYVAVLEEQVLDAQQPIDEQIAATEEALDDVDAQISAAMAPYLEVTPVPGEAYPPIPGIDQVAPSLTSSQSLLRSTLVSLQQDRARIRANSPTEGVIVERATLASDPLLESNRLLLVAGGVAGAFAGLLLALVAARLSPRVLDDRHVEDIVGRPPLGTFEFADALVGDLRRAVERAPRSTKRFVSALAVRTEAHGRAGAPLSVVVTGTDRNVGTSTLAALLAQSFATDGSRVLLIDADHQNPELTTLTNTSASLGGDRVLHNLTATDRETLVLASLVSGEGSGALRRRNLGAGLAEAAQVADVSVVDAGPILGSSAALELARRADCLVLVLAPNQRVQPLAAIAEELTGLNPVVVWSEARRSGWRRVLGSLGRGRRDSDAGAVAESAASANSVRAVESPSRAAPASSRRRDPAPPADERPSPAAPAAADSHLRRKVANAEPTTETAAETVAIAEAAPPDEPEAAAEVMAPASERPASGRTTSGTARNKPPQRRKRR